MTDDYPISCEEHILPQKVYYRKGAFDTVIGEINYTKAAVFANKIDLEI